MYGFCFAFGACIHLPGLPLVIFHSVFSLSLRLLTQTRFSKILTPSRATSPGPITHFFLPQSLEQVTKVTVAFGCFSAFVAVVADSHAVARARSMGQIDITVCAHTPCPVYANAQPIALVSRADLRVTPKRSGKCVAQHLE